MARSKLTRALEDAEYDLDKAGERGLACDAWLLKRKVEKNPDYVPTWMERHALQDIEDKIDVMDARELEHLRKRR